MARVQRPLSPHLQVYKWGLHMVLSILHRATGAALGAGTLLLAWWLIALASGPEQYDRFLSCMESIPGRVVLLGFTWALMLHLCNGIRHLFWDMGKGFELATVSRSNQAVLLGSILLTGLAWAFGYGLI
ncbi:succinate dehydrogenase, cytochrome b556 subunit [Luteithermobacter gelatinilyticus]|uniref:succinate dehydrogenase, cytochrome b556 subunit n=1 Tax=Luteithermobacter gelatinilyticus TaxID=2582913 RepID=UPI001106973E|nr:succinate dehydrogenase, cytochrome b556 subunit [Luteithermobacter gelatinilyticus]|tara:strand:- start:11600 stop:11986 length:387 start_codon:yes stop_codon:yes gene_type:complete